jgi:hypothetical protein
MAGSLCGAGWSWLLQVACCKPYINPNAIFAAPMRLAAVKLPSALCNTAQAINAAWMVILPPRLMA